jgi:hypothetical protein
MSSKNSKRATGEIEDPLLQTELISASVDENSDLSVQEKPASNKQLLVVIYSVMLLISAVGNSVFNKKMTNQYESFCPLYIKLHFIQFAKFTLCLNASVQHEELSIFPHSIHHIGIHPDFRFYRGLDSSIYRLHHS